MKEGVRAKAIAGFIWTMTQNVGVQLSSLVVFVILARLLTPVDFGLVAMANVSIAFLSLFSGAALTSALVQRPEIESEHLDTMFWTVLGLSLFLAAGAWWLAPGIAGFFGENELQQILRWLVVCLVFSAFQQIQISLLRRDLNFRSLALRSLVSEPIAGAIGIALAFMGFGVWSLVARTVASSAIQALVLWHTTAWRPRFVFSVPHLRDLFGFGINVAGANALDFASRQLDVFLIGYMLGAGPLGIYTVAKRIVVLLADLIGGTIEHVAWPIFSRIQQDSEKVLTSFYKATQFVSLLAFPVFVGIALLAENIVPVVFGVQWQSSAPLMQVLAVIGLVQSVLRFHETLMVGMGRPQYKFRLQALLAMFNLAAFFIAIQYGLLAVTVGYAIVAIALAPIWILCVRAVIELDISEYSKQYISAVAGSAFMAASILLAGSVFPLDEASLAGLAAQVCVGFVAYAVAIGVLEKDLLLELARAAINRRSENV